MLENKEELGEELGVGSGGRRWGEKVEAGGEFFAQYECKQCWQPGLWEGRSE